MANLSQSRNAVPGLGGKQLRDHRLRFDAPASTRYSDQRASSDEAASRRGNHKTGGRGSEQSASEDAANEDDGEDSSTPDDQEDEEGIPGGLAPSHGLGKGKGKRPAIRVEAADDDESADDDETTSHETGFMSGKHPVTQLLRQNKKRTFSNLSNTSVLFGDDDTDQHLFPRRKVPRKLSNCVTKPLLTYQEDANGVHVNDFENAIESDDDEDYSGVNLVPDDDESDIENMEMQEESFIIEDERQHATATATALINEYTDARRLSLDSSASDNIFELTAPLDEAFLAGVPDYGFAQFFESEARPASPDPAVKRKYSDSSTKRVRFDDEVQVSDSSSTSSSEELDSTLFPDLFMEQDKLPPILHQLLENDNDEDDGDIQSPMSDVSFWDFGNDEAHLHNNNDSDFDDDSSDPGSSGYETDMGDTTDDDSDFASDAPPQTPVQKKSVLRKPSSAPGSRASTPKPFQRNSRPTGRQIPPARGIFIHDDSNKAIAVTNRTTKTLSFYRPRTQIISWIPLNGTHSSSASTANNSPRASLAQFNASDSEISNDVFSNALSTDIMLSGIFGSAPGNDFIFGGESVGPPEAFYPFVSIGAKGNIMDDEDEYVDSEDYEDDLNITDFMDFGSDADDTDVEQDEEMDIPATPATSMIAMTGSTPAQPTPMSSTPTNRKRTTSDVMLEHFDRGVVTAFRNNQNRYRDIACLPSDPSARAIASRPVRSGRSAETVITPLRKRSNSRKTANSPYHASSPLRNRGSPLAGVTKAASRLQHSVMNNHRGPPPRMGTFS